jgi:hypothetical protein
MNIKSLIDLAFEFIGQQAPGLNNQFLVAALQLVLPQLENLVQMEEEKAVAELQEEVLKVLREMEIA